MGKELVDSPSATGVSHDYSHRQIIADPDEAADIVKEKSRDQSFNSPSGRIDAQIVADADEEGNIVTEKIVIEFFVSPSGAEVSHDRSWRTN
jgi:hypothetical protein